MKLTSGSIKDGLRRLRDGEVLELLSGVTYQGGSFYDISRAITIRGNGATIKDGLKFANCGALDLSDFETSDVNTSDRKNGLFVVGCRSFTGRRLIASRNASNGILTANTSDTLLENCVTNHNKDGHGVYFSQSGDRLTVQHCTSKRNGRAGIQINADEENRKAGNPLHDSVSQTVRLIANTLWGNQTKYDAAALTIACCRDVQLSGNVIDEHGGRNGIAIWDDGTGIADLACRDVLVEGTRFGFAAGTKVEACISIVGRHSQGIKVARSNVFPAGLKDVLSEVPFEWV
jgi:hypothetical protein